MDGISFAFVVSSTEETVNRVSREVERVSDTSIPTVMPLRLNKRDYADALLRLIFKRPSCYHRKCLQVLSRACEQIK